MSQVDQGLQDPRKVGHTEEFPAQHQPFPGIEAKMNPRPDFGEATYRGSGRLQGRAALITGADSGIGRAVALAFAREGADVAISYFNEHEDAFETQRVVEEAGQRAILLPGDIQEEAHCIEMVQRTVHEFGKLDVLVNNAAYQMSFEDTEQITTEEIDRVFRTNIYAMFWLCREALRVMPPGSAIINTASIEAYQPKAMLLPYATSKGAIVTFTKALAQQAIEKGVRVNAVAPGPIWTPLGPMSLPTEVIEKFGQSTPMKRAAQPFEVAPIFVLLASNEASYMTGDIYGVAGGSYLA